MSRVCLSFLLVSGLWAQTAENVFEKAPPEADAALRDRITKFYQAQTEKKYRLAQQYVAEDSIDTFLGLNKVSCISFKIDKLTYSDKFTKAKSIVFCSQYLPFPGFEKPVDVPMPDEWKMDRGEWFWTLDLTKGRATPFGYQMPPTSSSTGGGAPAPPPASLDTLLQGVVADKTEVTLNATDASTAIVKLANVLPGPVTLHLQGSAAPGLKIILERTELKAGEQTQIRFESQANAGRKTLAIEVVASPINKVIPLTIFFQ